MAIHKIVVSGKLDENGDFWYITSNEAFIKVESLNFTGAESAMQKQEVTILGFLTRIFDMHTVIPEKLISHRMIAEQAYYLSMADSTKSPAENWIQAEKNLMGIGQAIMVQNPDYPFGFFAT